MLPGSFFGSDLSLQRQDPDPSVSLPALPASASAMAASEPLAGPTEIIVSGITFASADTLQASIKTSKMKTEIFTLADHLKKINEVVTIFRLQPDNLSVWSERIGELIIMTDTACAFLPDPRLSGCGEKALALWKNFWVTKLKEASPSEFKFEIGLSPVSILSNILNSVTERSTLRVNSIAAELWGIRAKTDQSLSSFLKQVEQKLTSYRSHFTMVSESEIAFRAVLSFNLSILRPELALRCDGLSVDDTITELRKWAGRELPEKHTPSSQKNKPDQQNSKGSSKPKICDFCKAKGHLEAECRKKRGVNCTNCGLLGHTASTCRKEAKTISSASLSSPLHTFQLDTAADENTTGNRELFSSYSPCNLSVRLANASYGRILGKGTILVPATPKSLSLPAVHLDGCATTLLSLASLEKSGYHLHIPEDPKLDLQLRDSSRHSSLSFQRRGPRYIWEPPSLPSPSWHSALGHVNEDFVARTLRQHSIKPPPPSATPCVPCAKAKFVKSPGKGNLISATAKLQVIHLDLVGGKDSLPSSTGLSDVPAASYCLLLIDEFTRFKWQIPVYHKDDCPQLLKAFLLSLSTSFGRFPARIHSDRGSEFINGKIQDFLSEKGILWTGSAAYAHEQNGLIERTVRTVFEALRACHIHANIPLKLWPISLAAVVSILNSTSSSRIATSPFFELHGHQPELNKHPLGCRVLFRLDDKKNPKLESRTEEGIYLGTSHNTTTIYSLKSKRIVTRRDFTAIPTEFPLVPSTPLSISLVDSISASSALSSSQRELWYQAMNAESQQMIDRQVWSLVPRSDATTRPMTGTWILKEKADGSLKARWVARGFSEPNIKDIYADVLHAVTVRMLFAYAASNQFNVHHIDITAAFLNAELDEDIFLEQPSHLPKIPGMVCKLNKAIYGLRSAPRRWQQSLRQKLLDIGFTQLKFDPNVFRRRDTIISTYVDDFKVIGPDAPTEAFISELEKIYKLRRLGPISSYLGMEVVQSLSPDGFCFKLSQQAKIAKLLLDLNVSRPVDTPIADDNKIDLDTADPSPDPELYRSAVGQLLHISLLTRPDISYAVLRLTQHVSQPSHNAHRALIQCARYLLRTKDLTLSFLPGKSTILASSDSSWGTATQSKATTGNVFLLNGAPVAWAAKKQSLTAQSTCEAEYIAASTLSTTARWILPLFNEIWQHDHGPITVQMDNQAAILTANSGGLNSRNRHYLIRNAVLKEALKDRTITLSYTPSEQVVADGFTKALQRIKHGTFLSLLKMSTSGGGVEWWSRG